MPRSPKTPNEEDHRVGALIRSLRIKRNLSQTELGAAAGITFQQIQKYEKGTNRVSASRLKQIAEALGVPTSSFFEEGALTKSEHDQLALIETPGSMRMMTAFNDVHDTEVRRLLVRLVEVVRDSPSNKRAGKAK